MSHTDEKPLYKSGNVHIDKCLVLTKYQAIGDVHCLFPEYFFDVITTRPCTRHFHLFCVGLAASANHMPPAKDVTLCRADQGMVSSRGLFKRI